MRRYNPRQAQMALPIKTVILWLLGLMVVWSTPPTAIRHTCHAKEPTPVPEMNAAASVVVKELVIAAERATK